MELRCLDGLACARSLPTVVGQRAFKGGILALSSRGWTHAWSLVSCETEKRVGGQQPEESTWHS